MAEWFIVEMHFQGIVTERTVVRGRDGVSRFVLNKNLTLSSKQKQKMNNFMEGFRIWLGYDGFALNGEGAHAIHIVPLTSAPDLTNG